MEIFTLIGRSEDSGAAENCGLRMVLTEHSGGMCGHQPYTRDVHHHSGYVGGEITKEQMMTTHGSVIGGWYIWVTG